MKKNVGGIDRTLRIVIGLVLIGLAVTGTVGLWGYLGIEPLISPRISENWGNSLCTYVPES